MTEQQHCKTCDHFVIDVDGDRWCKKVQWVFTSEEREAISRVGCASHSSRTAPEPEPLRYVITENELEALAAGCQNEYGEYGHTDPEMFDVIRSRPAPALDLKFNSTDLLLLANDEWRRREERKHNHAMIPWCAGFISGFLTDKKWARELLDAMQHKEEP